MLWWTLQQLKSKDAKTRLKAVEKLASMEDISVLDPLLTALGDADPAVRRLTVSALGKLKDERAANPLVKALHDREAAVREAAAEALREIGDRRAMEPLVAALKDDSSGVRWRAASALDSLGWSPANEVQKALQLVALGKLEKASELGSAAIEPLIATLKTSVYYKRMQAVEALAWIGDPKVVKPLIEALKDEDSNVRAKAVEGLASLGDSRAVEPLILALRDKDTRVRATVIEALSKLGDPRAIDPLAKLLKDSAWDVRMASVEGLGKFKDSRVITHLVNCLNDKDRDTRLAAVISIGKIGDTAAIEHLVLSLTDEHDQIRQTSASVLRRLNKDWEKSEQAKRAVNALRQRAQATDYWVRQAAVEVLSKMGEIEATKEVELESKLSKAADPMQARKQATLEAFLLCLDDSDRDLRQAAAEALGRLADKRATDFLAKHIQDKDETVRKASAKSLHSLGWETKEQELRGRQLVLLERWDDAISLGEPAIPALAEASASRTSNTRQAAVKALSKIKSARIGEALAARLADDIAEIRHMAALALQAAGWTPRTPDQAARYAIEVKDWESAAQGGSMVIPLLMDIIKAKDEHADSWQGAESALSAIRDAAATPFLIELCQDPDLAAASARALENILADGAHNVSDHQLGAILELPGLAQNQFEFDQQTATFQIVGFEPVDISRVVHYVNLELDRRRTTLAAAG
ncbi:MAG TPA: HEAT repeat domain-containing protein [Verrucomicrobiae bacterium]